MEERNKETKRVKREAKVKILGKLEWKANRYIIYF